jgi:two-component system chemotaxis sensor kinase CheA/two-component system sensor histidine kinase and response regulator WspE
MEDVKRKFLPRFVSLAKERIRAGLDVAQADLRGEEALHLARELHSLAGEAGLLGFSELLSIARAAEEAATELHSRRTEERSQALKSALSELHVAVCRIEDQIDSQPSG